MLDRINFIEDAFRELQLCKEVRALRTVEAVTNRPDSDEAHAGGKSKKK